MITMITMITRIRTIALAPVASLLIAWAVVTLVSCASTSSTSGSSGSENVQYTFSSPEEAGLALANAASDLDGDSLRSIFGPDVSQLSSGDSTQDDLDLQRFAIAYDNAHSIQQDGPNVAYLVVGERSWVFPVPLVRTGERWHFDTGSGGANVLAARIDSNESAAVATLLSLAGAEQIYFSMDPDGDGVNSFASRIVSSDGARDGLYWPDSASTVDSPVGDGIALADALNVNPPTPSNGYFFRVLPPTGQRGSTVVAIAAYPATYGETGRGTFVILDGNVWRRDLGPSTSSTVKTMQNFAPGQSWTRVPTP